MPLQGIVRFHAVYWPAFLLAAGEPLSTRVHVHPYLTVDGSKLSKSSGGGLSPTELATTYGSDALRWWIATDVSSTSDTDFTLDRLVAKANEDLANGVGNAVNRITTLRHRQHPGADPNRSGPLDGSSELAGRVAEALTDFDRRAATQHLTEAIDQLNQHIGTTAPWKLARQPDGAEELAALLDTYIQTLRCIAAAIEPITPDLAHRINRALDLAPDIAPSAVYLRLSHD